jgi:hypothetical protein
MRLGRIFAPMAISLLAFLAGAGTASAGTWYLKNSLGGGTADRTFSYGGAQGGDIPVAGDWNNDGIDTPGVVNGNTWYLSDTLTGGNPTRQVFGFGAAGDVPLVGDWNGDGVDTAGVFRQGWWYLTDSPTGASTDYAFFYGQAGDIPVAGDWNVDGKDSPGVYRSGAWYLRDARSGGNGDYAFTYGGNPGVKPLVGDWNNDVYDTAGIVDNNVWYLENGNDGGNADVTPFAYGQVGWHFLAGDWDGDGRDTMAAIDPTFTTAPPTGDPTQTPPEEDPGPPGPAPTDPGLSPETGEEPGDPTAPNPGAEPPRGLAGASKTIKRAGSRTIEWREGKRQVRLTLDVDYRAYVIAGGVQLQGIAHARSNYSLERLCLRHNWTIYTSRMANSDRPVTFNWEQGYAGSVIDFFRANVTKNGMDWLYRGPAYETEDAREFWVSLMPDRNTEITWYSALKPVRDFHLRVQAGVAPEGGDCQSRPVKVAVFKD